MFDLTLDQKSTNFFSNQSTDSREKGCLTQLLKAIKHQPKFKGWTLLTRPMRSQGHHTSPKMNPNKPFHLPSCTDNYHKVVGSTLPNIDSPPSIITSATCMNQFCPKGLPYMTSAKRSEFFTPPGPPCRYHKSADFVPFVCFLSTPPHPLRTSYMEAPKLWREHEPFPTLYHESDVSNGR